MKFVLVSDIEDTGMDVYGADADACVAEEVAVLPNGLVAIDVGGNTYVVNPSVIHSTNDSSPAAPLSTPADKFADADGNTRPIGSSARLRLSRLSAFNISKAGRNGVIKSVSDDGTLVLAFDTGLIAVTVGRSDFRWN